MTDREKKRCSQGWEWKNTGLFIGVLLLLEPLALLWAEGADRVLWSAAAALLAGAACLGRHRFRSRCAAQAQERRRRFLTEHISRSGFLPGRLICDGGYAFALALDEGQGLWRLALSETEEVFEYGLRDIVGVRIYEDGAHSACGGIHVSIMLRDMKRPWLVIPVLRGPAPCGGEEYGLAKKRAGEIKRLLTSSAAAMKE